jgi:hypothetical protein
MDREEFIALLRESLTIEATTKSEYNGGMGDGPCYSDYTTISLLWDGEVISSTSL